MDSTESCTSHPFISKEWFVPAWRCRNCKVEIRYTVGIGWHHHPKKETHWPSVNLAQIKIALVA